MGNQELTVKGQGELVPAGGRPMDQNAAAVYLASLTSKRSRVTMQDALNDVCRILGAPEIRRAPTGRQAKGDNLTCFAVEWAALRYQHTAAIRAALGEQYTPAGANLRLSALRGVLRQAWKLGQMTAEDFQRAADVKNIKASSDPTDPANIKGRYITPAERDAMLRACVADKSPAGARDAAMLAVFIAAGPRREEVAAMDLADYDQQNGALVIRHGKGNKTRTAAYVTNGAGRYLADWLKIRGQAPGPLFVPILKGGRLDPRRMTAQALWNAVQKRAAAAGVPHLGLHDFRRTWISDLLDAGADIATVARMAGHANVATTARYDRRGEAAKERASNLVHVPYYEGK